MHLDRSSGSTNRCRVKRENFQTKMTSNGAFGWLPSSFISLNWGLPETRPLSASSMYSLATE